MRGDRRLVEPGQVQSALERNEVEPCFQPIVEIHSGRLMGFEVLARWRHPELGLILPPNFIEVAETQGLIDRLTDSLVEQAFAHLNELPPHCQLAINISPTQLENPALPSRLGAMAERAGFPMNRLVVEITESAIIHNMAGARIILNELHSRGCTLALDDFGTGYSSLSHLHMLPFDKLKIDLSCVKTMTTSREGRKIVASIIGLGHSLGMKTVAEGVETEDQAEMLLWLGCELAQGWLYGRCGPRQALGAMVAATPKRVASRFDRRNSSLEAFPAQRLAQLQAIYDGAPVGLAFLDENLRYVSVNTRLAMLNGLPVSEHLGRTVEEVLPEVYPLYRDLLQRALAGETISDVVLKRPPTSVGGQEWIALANYQPARDEGGEIVGISVAVLDITDRQKAEEALRKSEAELRSVFEAVPLGIFISDGPGGKVSKANNEALRMHPAPFPAPTCIQEYVQFGLRHPDGRVADAEEYPLAQALMHGKVDRKLMLGRDSEGKEMLLDVWAGPVRSKEGGVVGGIAVVKDVDAVRRARELLTRAISNMKRLLLNAASGTPV